MGDYKEMPKEKEIREDFCGACLAVPLAFAGVGASAYGSGGSRKKHKSQKKIAMLVGIISILVSIGVAVYYLYIKDCSNCR